MHHHCVCCGVSHACARCRTGERIAFNYLISQKYTGEHAELEVSDVTQ